MTDRDKRLRYYNGQFLQEQDFTAEQEYHLDRQRRHNRQLHTYGIAEGLTVTANVGAASAAVSPGTAIDSEGRMIILTQSLNLAVSPLTNQWVLVVIAYKEQPSNPATVGAVENTRWWEHPDVQVIAETDAPAADLSIRLARLQLAADGTISQYDPSVRTLTGKLGPGSLKVQSPLGTSPQFVQDQNGSQSPLAISAGKVGIGTNDLQYVLTIAGNVSQGPIAEARSQGDTASIQYANNNSGVWHAGVDPANNFFFWSKPTSTSALITPDGIVTANGLKLSHQGVAADVTGDVSVTGKITVTGTVDGRDVSADGAKLDTLASSTIEGISNPGGNIDLVGQNGITVTGDNTAKTIRVAGPAGGLATPGPLGAATQFVQDQSGTPSPLAIGTGKVGIGTNDLGYVFTIAGNVSGGPIAEIRSQGDSGSIQYTNNNGGFWTVGVGPANNFFFVSKTGPSTLITPQGVVTANGLKLSGPGTVADVTGDVSVAGKILVTGTVDGRDVSADGAKLDALGNSTIEGVSNPGKNIDLAGQNGITITGDNIAKKIIFSVDPSMLGGLSSTAYLKRALRPAVFSQQNDHGATQVIDVGFQPKFISLEGTFTVHVVDSNTPETNMRNFGGAIGGHCLIDDAGNIQQHGHGPILTQFYASTDSFPRLNMSAESNFDGICYMESTHPEGDSLLYYVRVIVSVDAILPSGFRIRLDKATGDLEPSFTTSMFFAVLG